MVFHFLAWLRHCWCMVRSFSHGVFFGSWQHCLNVHRFHKKNCLCILGGIMYKTAWGLRQSLTFILIMATLNTASTHLFTSLCFSLCTFYCHGSSLWRSSVRMWSLWKFIFWCTSEWKYQDKHLWNWKQHSSTSFSQFLSHCLPDYGFVRL